MAVKHRSIPPLRDKDILRFWSHVHIGKPDECWPWMATRTARGYGQFHIGVPCPFRAHRVAWTIAHGPIPPGLCVCHQCDNPPCCNPAHAFLETKTKNNWDMKRKGRAARGDRHSSRTHPEAVPRGERCSWAKLKETDIVTIRRRAAKGVRQRILAKQFGIGQDEISRIVNQKRWAHVI